MMFAVILCHGVSVVWYFVVFALIMLLGVFYYVKAKKISIRVKAIIRLIYYKTAYLVKSAWRISHNRYTKYAVFTHNILIVVGLTKYI